MKTIDIDAFNHVEGCLFNVDTVRRKLDCVDPEIDFNYEVTHQLISQLEKYAFELNQACQAFNEQHE